jgi:hypothetical protein
MYYNRKKRFNLVILYIIYILKALIKKGCCLPFRLYLFNAFNMYELANIPTVCPQSQIYECRTQETNAWIQMNFVQ